MTDTVPDRPSTAVSEDAANAKAPDPRRHYDSPEDLRDDIDLDLAAREELLRQWMLDLDQRLDAEAEGMSSQDPISQEKEARLANEAHRVAALLAEVVEELEKCAAIGTSPE